MQPATLAAFQRSARAAVAASTAVAVAGFFELQFPAYAMITAVVVTDLSPTRTRELALPRFAGTVMGAVLGAVLSYIPQPGGLVLALAVFIGCFSTHVVGLQEASKVAGYVTGIVLFTHAGDPWSHAFLRSAETLIGIAAAVLMSLVPPLLKIKDPESGPPPP